MRFIDKFRDFIGLPPIHEEDAPPAPVVTAAELEVIFRDALEAAAAPHVATLNPEAVAEAAYNAATYVATCVNPTGGVALWAALGLIKAAEDPTAAMAVLRMVLARKAHGLVALPVQVAPTPGTAAAPASQASAAPMLRSAPLHLKRIHDDTKADRTYQRGRRVFTAIDGGKASAS